VAGLLEQIEIGDNPRSAALYVRQILAQKGLTPAGRIDVLFRVLQVRDRAICRR